jgi:hypothetical protein
VLEIPSLPPDAGLPCGRGSFDGVNSIDGDIVYEDARNVSLDAQLPALEAADALSSRYPSSKAARGNALGGRVSYADGRTSLDPDRATRRYG